MRLTRPLKMTAAMLATAALGVSAASALVSPSSVVSPQSLLAQPGSDRLEQTAPDPGGGLDWAVRSYISTSAGSCVEAGRLSAGRFGSIGPNGVFEAIPLQEGGTCANLLEDPVLLAINHYPAVEDLAPRTVLFGRARTDVTEVQVTVPNGAPRRLATGAGGGFLMPLAGALQATDLPVQVALADGRRLTYDWR
ncbi:MAG: hypothetical protein QOG42_1494 [Solirubrobacteraceae bacterium]|nr:hypothetical protein [Solirubrobacteraceae bacterium]